MALVAGPHFRVPVVPHAGHFTVAGLAAGPANTVWPFGHRIDFWPGPSIVPSWVPVVPAPTTVCPREGPRNAARAGVPTEVPSGSASASLAATGLSGWAGGRWGRAETTAGSAATATHLSSRGVARPEKSTTTAAPMGGEELGAGG